MQSHRAFLASSLDDSEQERTARAINGEIVSESETECLVGVSEVSSEEGKALIKKRRMAIRRKAVRLRTKAIAEQACLSRKVTKRTSKLLQDCPTIGEEIESFVQDNNVGADAWRRTGVLTFDGNVKLGNKVTYKRIKEHVEKVFNRKVSYGSIVELCVPRNKRRSSAKRYKGLAKVTTRRARKGFTLKFNPDAHWSAAFYKGLNSIQYVDGRSVLNINRDDAASFRLDTLTTCKQDPNPVVRGNDILTTRTDYVNRYPSQLQTTSYNFTATETTLETCVGVVKALPVHCKNPPQHYFDLVMLSNTASLQPVFVNPVTGVNKQIDCIRVDGAADEGPSHEAVQFWWTLWHFTNKKVATLVTTRSSGSSYLHRVELQNGCLALGHSNTFIPSTLAGSCYDEETGTVDQAKLKENLNMAISAYISRVNGCPCGDSNLMLFRGSDSGVNQVKSENLSIFLKGSKRAKEKLKSEHPDEFDHFQMIWNIRNRHLVQGLPSSYVFFLNVVTNPIANTLFAN